MTDQAFSLQEAVLKLWNAGTHSDTIMALFKIDEVTLDQILPRSLWLGAHMKQCRHCAGRGYFVQTVSWESRDRPGPDWAGLQDEVMRAFPMTLEYLASTEAGPISNGER